MSLVVAGAAVVIRELKNLARSGYHRIRTIRSRIKTRRCDKKLARVLDQIAAADLEELLKADFVETLIQQIGLRKDTRDIYGDDEAYMNPIERGLWQIPKQLAELAVFLAPERIESFLEIGTFTGHTFTFLMAYLSRFNPSLAGITLDVGDYDPVKYLCKDRFNTCFVIGRSQDFVTSRFDLCLIDGDHSYDVLSHDFHNVGKNSRICVFHDINDAIVEGWPGNDGGVPRFWQQLKTSCSDRDFSEYTYHSRGNRVMGFGVEKLKCTPPG
jgi:hypothetical protein